MTGLSDILSGNDSAPAPAPEPAPERSPEPAPAPERQPAEPLPTGDKQPAQEPGAAPPAAQQEPEHVPFAALKDERAKRQQLERRLAEVEQQNRPQPAPPKRPDLFENPDGALDYVQQQVQQELVKAKLSMSALMAQQQFPDYLEVEPLFIEAMNRDPRLWDQMLADPHPAAFAYRVGNIAKVQAEIGPDPRAYRDKVRAEVEAEVRAKVEAEFQAAAPAPRSRSSIPPTLAAARDTSGRFAPAYDGPPSLADIIAPRR